MTDQVKQPAHYTGHPSGVEPITITKHMNFPLGSVIKYVMRCDLKGKPIEDLKKARQFLDIEIEERERQAAVKAEADAKAADRLDSMRFALHADYFRANRNVHRWQTRNPFSIY